MKKIVRYFILLVVIVLAYTSFTSRDLLLNTGFSKLNKSSMIDIVTPLQAFTDCFKKGDPYALSPFFAENVLFMTDEREEIFLGKETEKALVLFFANHPPKYFLIRHNSMSKGGKSLLLVGKYESQNKDKFRITASIIENEIDMLELCMESEEIF